MPVPRLLLTPALPFEPPPSPHFERPLPPTSNTRCPLRMPLAHFERIHPTSNARPAHFERRSARTSNARYASPLTSNAPASDPRPPTSNARPLTSNGRMLTSNARAPPLLTHAHHVYAPHVKGSLSSLSPPVPRFEPVPPTSNARLPTSDVPAPTSNVHPPTSKTRPSTSNARAPTSNARTLTSKPRLRTRAAHFERPPAHFERAYGHLESPPSTSNARAPTSNPNPLPNPAFEPVPPTSNARPPTSKHTHPSNPFAPSSHAHPPTSNARTFTSSARPRTSKARPPTSNASANRASNARPRCARAPISHARAPALRMPLTLRTPRPANFEGARRLSRINARSFECLPRPSNARHPEIRTARAHALSNALRPSMPHPLRTRGRLLFSFEGPSALPTGSPRTPARYPLPPLHLRPPDAPIPIAHTHPSRFSRTHARRMYVRHRCAPALVAHANPSPTPTPRAHTLVATPVHPPCSLAGRTHARAHARRTLQPVAHAYSLRTHTPRTHTPRKHASAHTCMLVNSAACTLVARSRLSRSHARRTHARRARETAARMSVVHARPSQARSSYAHACRAPCPSRTRSSRARPPARRAPRAPTPATRTLVARTPSAPMLVPVVMHVHLSCTPTLLAILALVPAPGALLAHACPSHESSSRETEHPRPPLSNTPRRACKSPARTL
ncbi:hypothetical protein K438DRAFT_1997235, partial [Mycena galopus ATCC 62051]